MRPHGRASVSRTNPEAFAQCDRCGFWYNRTGLQWQFQWAGTHLYNIGFLVCKRCIDVPFEQLRTIILPPDPPPVLNARPPNFAFEEAGPVQSILTASVPMGGTSLPIQDVTGFVAGTYVWIQLNIGTFAQELIQTVDSANNIITIASPLPALAPKNGVVTVSSTLPVTLDPVNTSPGLTLSNGNLSATAVALEPDGNVSRSTVSQSSSKIYFESTLSISTVSNVAQDAVGLLNANQPAGNYLGETTTSIGFYGGPIGDGGFWFNNNLMLSWPNPFSQGDTIAGAVDVTNKLLWFYAPASNLWNNSITANPRTGVGGFNISAITGALFAGIDLETFGTLGDQWTVNFGTSPYVYPRPAGFGNLTL